MSLPRPVLPGRFYLITRRCTQRQFLLRPDAETNNAFAYCLAEAAERFGMEIVGTTQMSNHHHTVIFDRHGRYPEFLEHFHKLLARCMNVYRRRTENFWSSDQVSVVHLVETSDVINKLVYTATNPVKDQLVERVSQWPGVNGWLAMRSRTTIEATRPKFFFRKTGTMPEKVTLRMVVPKELGMSERELIDVLERRIAEVEADARAVRKRTRRQVLGARAVLNQRCTSRPSTEKPRRLLRPRFAAADEGARRDAIERYRRFLETYQVARSEWLRDEPTEFPPGTYWLVRHAKAPIAPPPS